LKSIRALIPSSTIPEAAAQGSGLDLDGAVASGGVDDFLIDQPGASTAEG
jgi:hypothetical protein